MKTIEKYVAEDGTEWKTAPEAIERDREVFTIDRIISRLPKRPEGCDFLNGRGYVQHADEFWTVRDELLLFIQKETVGHKWVQQTIDNRSVHPSYVGRLIDDCGHAPLSRAWYRISCTNARTLREYGQPYYADNPEKADGGQVNP